MNNNDLRLLTEKALIGFLDRDRQHAPWEGRKVVIYGAGHFGRDLGKIISKRPEADLLGFLDQNGTGQQVLEGWSAYRPDSETASRWMAEKPVVIIGAHNAAAPLREIKARLNEFGFRTVITPMEAYARHGKDLDWRFWLGTSGDYSDAASLIERTRALWADPQSERLFLETLIFRLGFNLEMAASPADVSLQYIDPSVPPWPEPIRMVDGGSYTGDTFQSMRDRGSRFSSIHAFEPDAANFHKLSATATNFGAETQISLWPCGLGSSTCRLKFTEGQGVSSRLSETGTLLPIVALDDVLHGQAINMIKLDIEGAEPLALEGARGIIEKYRPALAVCLYHDPRHLWSIPLWISNLNLDYEFYYRFYSHNTWEVVLYAFPKQSAAKS